LRPFTVAIVWLTLALCVSCKQTNSPSAHSVLTGSDRYKIWDIVERENQTIAVIYIFTTFPDFMQRIDIFVFNGSQKMISRADLLTTYRRLSVNLEDHFKQLDSGGYEVRVGVSGNLDLENKRLIVKFDKGKSQKVPIDIKKLALHKQVRQSTATDG